jgi:hypothetical protein
VRPTWGGCICDASALRLYSTMACEALEVLDRVAPKEKERIMKNADAHARRIRQEREQCPNHVRHRWEYDDSVESGK